MARERTIAHGAEPTRFRSSRSQLALVNPVAARESCFICPDCGNTRLPNLANADCAGCRAIQLLHQRGRL